MEHLNTLMLAAMQTAETADSSTIGVNLQTILLVLAIILVVILIIRYLR